MPDSTPLTRFSMSLIASEGRFVNRDRSRRDVVAPAGECAVEVSHLGRAEVVLETDAELGEERGGEVGIGDLVDRWDDFFGV